MADVNECKMAASESAFLASVSRREFVKTIGAGVLGGVGTAHW